MQIYIKSARFYTIRIKKETDNPFFRLSVRALCHNFINLEVNFKILNMERKRTVADLNVHKDTIFLCIMKHDGTIILKKRMMSAFRGAVHSRS